MYTSCANYITNYSMFAFTVQLIEFKKPFKFKAINKLSVSLFYVTCARIRNQYITFAKMAFLPRFDLYCISQRKARPVL